MGYFVFISYRSKNQAFADKLKAQIEETYGIHIFLSSHPKDGTTVGHDFYIELQKHIDQSSVIIICLSKAWLKSDYCQDEFRLARYFNKPILPVVLDSLESNEDLKSFIEKQIGSNTYADFSINGKNAIRKLLHSLDTYIRFDEYKRQAYGFQGNNPYKELSGYMEKDAAVYFGRDKESDETLNFFETRASQTDDKNLYVIHGFSGVGKSSFMKAGVLAWMRFSGFQKSFQSWLVLDTFRPGEDPLTNLCETLFQKILACKTSRSDLLTSYRGFNLSQMRDAVCDKSTLNDLLRQLRMAYGKQHLLLSIDQFEEAYRHREANDDFFNVIRHILDIDGCFIILTIRTEYMDQLQKEPYDDDHFWQTKMIAKLLPSVDIRSIDDIIRGPAKYGLVEHMSIEEGFIDAVKADMREQIEALPLLSLYLHELFQTKGGIFKASDYHPGALFHRIEALAESAIDSLSEEELEALKNTFITHLLYFDEKENRTLKQKANIDILPKKAKFAIEALIAKRLLISNGTYVEVAHEAVFLHWKRLKSWIDDEREFLIVQERIKSYYTDWYKAPKREKDNALLHGLPLDLALKYRQNFQEPLKSYITFSEKHRQKLKKQRRFFIQSSIGLIFFGGMFSSYEWLQASKANRLANEELKNSKHNIGLFFYRYAFEFLREKNLAKAHLSAYIALSFLDFTKRDAKKYIDRLGGILQCYPYTPLIFKDKLHESGIWQVGITPNRKFVSLGDDGLAVFRNITDGKSVNELHVEGAVLYRFAWLNDHTLIIVERLGKIISYDINSRTKKTLFETDKYRFRSLSLHPNQSVVYIGTQKGEIVVFDISSKRIVQTIQIPQAALNVTSIAYTKGALFVYTANGVYRCNIDDKDHSTISGIDTIKHDEKLDDMVYDHHQFLLLYSFPAKVEVTKIANNTLKNLQNISLNINGKIHTAGSTPDNRRFFIVCNETLCLLDADGRIYEKIDSFKQNPKSLFYKKDLLGVGDLNGAFSLFDTQNKPHLLPSHNSKIYAVAIKNNIMVTGSDFLEAQLRIWDTKTYKVQHIINGFPNKYIITIAFLSEKHFIWGDGGGNIGLYNLNTQEKIIVKDAHNSYIQEFAIAKNHHLYSASTDKTIKEWYFDPKTQSLKPVRTIEGFFKDTIYSIALSPDNRFLAAGSFDRSVKIINLKTNRVESSYIEHSHHVYGVIFSPDGRFVYSCGRDHFIIKYDLYTHKSKKLEGHKSRIYHLRFTTNGKFLGSSSRDNTIRLWNRNDTCVAILKGHKQRIYQFAFFDNDTKIASVSWDKTINIWDISSLSENSDRTTILKPERTLKEFPGCEILSFKDKVLRLSDGTILDTSKIKQQIEKLKKQCQVTLQNNTQFIHHDNMFDTINWPPHHPFLDQYQS